MSVFKCKMCGGTIEFEPGATVGVCDSCGTKQTLPRLDSDRKTNLYDRADHFRRNNDFDKAMSIYEQILNEDPTDAEAYWSLVLCHYGIEYVEDPGSHKRVPTVNRAQFTSIFDDDNYKSALKYADVYQKSIYEEEAATINEIQKGILAISQKEDPFDVFICYKETDANGRRTQDSVLATDLYHQLVQEGFKVFFARITLEDKLGTAYEPYIFAALNSAKVMVVLGTKPEYFNAVWVKNEWSRYLALVKKSGGKKVLIPAYRDMDPYDLPEEFSHLQAQDMSKLGFMQDLIRGIKKIAQTEPAATAVKETVVVNSGNANVSPLLKRAFMFLEDGEWSKADDFCEQVLNIDPENAQAYLGKLLAELHIRKAAELAEQRASFSDKNNYRKALRFADEKLTDELESYDAAAIKNQEYDRLQAIYNDCIIRMRKASSEESFKAAAESFKKVSGFKDSDTLYTECLNKAEESRKDAIYNSAKEAMNASGDTDSRIRECNLAIERFESIPGWRDADSLVEFTRNRIEELKELAEKERIAQQQRAEQARIAAIKRKKWARIILIALAILIVLGVVYLFIISPRLKKHEAMSLIDAGNYDEAYALLEEIGDNESIMSSKYDRAVEMVESGDYDAAVSLIETMVGEVHSTKYNIAIDMINAENYEAAYVLLDGLKYQDSMELLSTIETKYAQMMYARIYSLFEAGNYDEAFNKLASIADDNIIKTIIRDISLKMADAGNIDDATMILNRCMKWLSNEASNELKEQWVKKLQNHVIDSIDAEDYDTAFQLLELVNDKEFKKSVMTDEMLSAAKVGNCIVYGKYNQDIIEWIVLEKEKNRMLVISKLILENAPFGSYGSTWKDCSLRKWLNEDFFENAFTSIEKETIQMVSLSTDNVAVDDEVYYDITDDHIFILSVDETERCFPDYVSRICGMLSVSDTAYPWWLRSDGILGTGRKGHACVLPSGEIYLLSYGQTNSCGVRPAMWITLKP